MSHGEMEFERLTEEELDEFIEYWKEDVELDLELSKIEQAKQIYSQLDPEYLEAPTPILDLQIASMYRNPLETYKDNLETYTYQDIQNLSDEELDDWMVELDLGDDLDNIRDRIYRILTFLDRIILPRDIISNPIISQEICHNLTLKELGKLVQATGSIPECHIEMNDPDEIITTVFLPQVADLSYLDQIESHGSKDVVYEDIRSGRIDRLKQFLNIVKNPNLMFGTRSHDTRPLIYYASDFGRTNMVELLLKYGADPNLTPESSHLNRAILNGDLDIVTLLLNYGMDPNLTSGENNTLMTAIIYNKDEIVNLLLQYGANPNSIDDGFTPIFMAIYNGNLEIVKSLLDYGADIDFQDNEGNSPLMEVVIEKDIEIAFHLIEKGADPSLQNNNGNTALDIARNKGYVDITDFLFNV